MTKQEMSSVDVAAVVQELSEFILDAKLGKIYQTTPDEIRIRVYTRDRGREDLVIEAGRRLHLTRGPRPSPRIPPAFPMLLRKHLMGGRIKEIKQYDFDRIVEFYITRGGLTTILVAELFSQGNIVLLDSERRIILPLKSLTFKGRTLRRGEPYGYPPAQLSPLEAAAEDLSRIMSESKADVVRTLATRLNMGGLYAEETLMVAGVDKTTPAREATPEQVEAMVVALRDLFQPIVEDNLHPHVVIRDSEPIDVLPIELRSYEGLERRYYPSINEALDAYFSVQVEEAAVERRGEKIVRKLSRLERRLEKQQAAMERFEQEAERSIAIGEAIYAHYQEIEEIFNTLRRARDQGYSWDQIKQTLREAAEKGMKAARMIKDVDEAESIITIKLDEHTARLNLKETIPRNAEIYYDRAKEQRRKIEGAKKAIEETRKLLEKEPEKMEAPKPRVKRKIRWYERFRWFYSSDGFLVVAGRDANTNEEVVKRYMDKRDLFFHTQAHGAPATIVKTEGKEIPEQTIMEAAQFAVSYSSIWKAGHFEGDAYWVHPEQVSKTPEPGEYVAKGAFIIRGERHYMKRVAVGAAVGIEVDKEVRVIGGPPTAVKKIAKYWVEVQPGDFAPNDLAKKIYRGWLESVSEGDLPLVRQAVDPDQIARFLPPGTTSLK